MALTYAAESSRKSRDWVWTISSFTCVAYARGRVFFRQTQPDGHARMVCYDLRAASKRSEDGRAKP